MKKIFSTLFLCLLFTNIHAQICSDGSSPILRTIDITGFNSNGNAGDASNTTATIDFGTGITYDVVGIEYSGITVNPNGPSWCSDAQLLFNDFLILTPAFTEDNAGPCNNPYSDSLVSLNDFDLDFATNADGTVDVEAIESFNDGGVDPDQTFGAGTVTLYACPVGTVLPVKLISFEGEASGSSNDINWSVASEVSFSHYEVEHSLDGLNWSVMTSVFPSESNEPIKDYEFIDEYPYKKSYYRLNMIDIDGSNEYSDIVYIENTQAKRKISLYPNPVKDMLNISSVDEVLSVKVLNVNGKVLFEKENTTAIDVSELPAGIYFIQIVTDGDEITIEKVVKH